MRKNLGNPNPSVNASIPTFPPCTPQQMPHGRFRPLLPIMQGLVNLTRNAHLDHPDYRTVRCATTCSRLETGKERIGRKLDSPALAKVQQS